MAPVANTSNTSAVPVVPHGALHPVAPARLNGIKGRPDMLAVGTVIWLASELMFFAALFAAYFNLRNVTTSMAAPGEDMGAFLKAQVAKYQQIVETAKIEDR